MRNLFTIRYRLFRSLSLFLLCAGPLIAQDDSLDYEFPEDMEVPLEAFDFDEEGSFFGEEGAHYDSTLLDLRVVPVDQLDKYLADDRFNYDPLGRSPDPSFLEQISEWIGDVLEQIFGASEVVSTIGEAIPWVLLVVAVILIVRSMVGRQIGGLLGRKRAESTLRMVEEIEDIHALDFPTLIAEALRSKDYRLAIRLHYLELLQRLSSAKVIDWRPEKTNGEYLTELYGTELYRPMSDLTLFFDYVWYGEFTIGSAEYERFRRDLEEAGGLLGRGRE